MNLLVLTATNGSYNSVRPEAEIYISLLKFGYNITIMTDEGSKYAKKFREHGIKVIDAHYNKKISPKTIKNIREAIIRHNIDIVYATNSKSISNAVFACIGTGVKLVTYRGTTGGLYRHDPSSYLNALNPIVDGVICVSEAVTKHVKKQIFNKSKKVKTIYKGHEVEWYNTQPINLEEFGTKNSNFNVAFVANVRKIKGLSYLLQAAKKLSNYEDIHILLIGENISKEPYLSEIKNSGMSERIHITGYRDNAPQIIASCSVLVQASIREGLSRVILEALAAKIPVIASANEGNKEIIKNGFNGLIVPIKDAGAIAEKIIELHDESEKLKQLSENCNSIFETQMSHKTTVSEYDRFFKELLQVL
ncbi:glycosyltransferase family 4 protein [Sulfurimonas sp.]|uniref:glycosyltransferase family 4 protein n=1 Tax=Sulfurimonas sp. TaxID=2022749 RepID=UPI0019F9D35B|nr:glycosyltransferase family 4 protein [Sulfurimonas sp.]MBE0514922.1 glycosyltransferase family 4 protein [Sulfurimonas sp.]